MPKTCLCHCVLQGKRYSLPNSRIMIHQPLGGAQGQATDIEIQVRGSASCILDVFPPNCMTFYLRPHTWLGRSSLQTSLPGLCSCTHATNHGSGLWLGQARAAACLDDAFKCAPHALVQANEILHHKLTLNGYMVGGLEEMEWTVIFMFFFFFAHFEGESQKGKPRKSQ